MRALCIALYSKLLKLCPLRQPGDRRLGRIPLLHQAQGAGRIPGLVHIRRPQWVTTLWSKALELVLLIQMQIYLICFDEKRALSIALYLKLLNCILYVNLVTIFVSLIKHKDSSRARFKIGSSMAGTAGNNEAFELLLFIQNFRCKYMELI